MGVEEWEISLWTKITTLFWSHPGWFIGTLLVGLMVVWMLISLTADAAEGHMRERMFTRVFLVVGGLGFYLILIYLNKTQGWLW